MSILKNYGLKETKQRLELISLFEKFNSLSIKEIKEKVNDIDHSTIYRIIKEFDNHNMLLMDVDGTQEIKYSLKSKHKHHLKCIKCSKVVEIDKCTLEDNKLIGDFMVLDHHLDIEGVCIDCRGK